MVDLVWQYPLGPPLHQLLRNHFNLCRWSSSGSDRGISHFFMATRNTIKGVGGKNKEQTRAWVNSSARRLNCDTLHSLCICRLSLPSILREIYTKLRGILTHLDWSSLTDAGLSNADWSLRCPVSTANCHCPSPVANPFFEFLCPALNSLSLTHFQSRLRSRVQTLCLVSRQNRQKGSSARRILFIVSH